MLDFLISGRCHPKIWDIHPRERGCSIKLLHYDNNKNEVTVQVVIFDRHNEIEEAGFEPANGGSKIHCLATWWLLSCIYLLKKFK